MRYKIIDITNKEEYEKYLHKCLAMPFRKYRKRHKYLLNAVPHGLCKKIIKLDDKVVGQIEYPPYEVAGLPIYGENIFVF